MVFFVCNGCGTSVKKNQVEKHQYQCRRSQHLSCVDCSKDFIGQEYKAHIKCVSEEEKYSGKDYVAKPNQNKNERKQTEWVAMIQNLVEKVGNTNDELSSALQRISQHENIPRKKPKFINFLKNILGNRVPPRITEQLWDLISKEIEELRVSKAPNVNNSSTKVAEKTEKTSDEENGIKRKHDGENKNPVNGNKKRKTEPIDCQNENICSQGNDTINSVGVDSSAKVKWCTIGKIILRAQDDKELSLKKFQKKIIGEYLNRMGDSLCADETVEVLWSKCQKKLSKNPKFKIHKEKIKLVA